MGPSDKETRIEGDYAQPERSRKQGDDKSKILRH